MVTIATRGINLPTDIGNVILTVTSPTHMHVETPGGQALTVRAVRYRVSLHLNLYDGVWSLTRNEHGREERGYLSAKKVDAKDWRKDDASDSAKDKILEVVAAKVNEWDKTADAARVLAQLRLDAAEAAKATNEATTKRLIEELQAANEKTPGLEEDVVAARHAFLHLTKNLNQ